LAARVALRPGACFFAAGAAVFPGDFLAMLSLYWRA